MKAARRPAGKFAKRMAGTDVTVNAILVGSRLSKSVAATPANKVEWTAKPLDRLPMTSCRQIA
jgi:hypothetical protein